MHLVQFLIAITPSFLISNAPTKHSPAFFTPRSSRFRTLDGIRGFACLVVFNEHYTYHFTDSFLFGYSVEGHYSLTQWPLIRLFWSGSSMVAIFFVVCGYVLSYKPLKAIRSGNIDKLQSSLGLSILRRTTRLLCPTWMALFIWAGLAYCGLFRVATEIYNSDGNFVYLYMRYREPPPEFPSFSSQMTDVLRNSLRLLNIRDWYDNSVSAHHYDPHTWTIPVEIRCSIVLYLTLSATARMRRAPRVLFVSSVVASCILFDQVEAALFLAGMLLVEVDAHIREKMPLQQRHSTSTYGDSYSRVPEMMWLSLFIAGLYLASASPYGCATTPGFATLYKIAPSTISDKSSFLRSLGAVGIVWAVVNSKTLKSCFDNGFSGYMSKISFAFYLTHGNILKSVGYTVIPYIFAITGVEDVQMASTTQLVMSWLLGLAVVLPVTICVADVFWRMVDVPCVLFVRRIAARIVQKSDADIK